MHGPKSYKKHLPEILLLSEGAYQQVRAHLSPPLYSQIDIYVYASKRDYNKIYKNNKQPKWVGGSGGGSVIALYQPYGGLWFRLKGYSPYYIIKHELAHIMINRLISECPAWLNEGFAMYIGDNEVRNVFQRKALLKRIQKEELIPLKQLHQNFSFIEDQKRANLAYAESLSVVQYIVDTYGYNKLVEFINDLAKGFKLDNSFQKSFGLTYDEFERNWQQQLKADKNS